MSKLKRYILFIALFLFIIFTQTISHITEDQYFFLNIAPGEPKGLYLLIPLKGDGLHLGEKVLLSTPDEVRGLLSNMPLLKTVGGLPGDRYLISDTSLYVNGRYFGTVYQEDSNGKALPQKRGIYVVQDDAFLPVATKAEPSIDGRCFGEVPIASVWGKAVPIITF